MNSDNNVKKIEIKQKPKQPNRRHQSRAYALQAIFQWHFSEESIAFLLQEFILDHLSEEKNIDLNYFRVLVLGTLKNVVEIDEMMTPLLDRPLSQLNPVELSALRLGLYELKFHPEVPHKVAINEAIELTKEFGAVEGYKFVNAVLNAYFKELKPKK